MTAADECWICGELKQEGLMYGRHWICPDCQPRADAMLEKLRGVRRKK